MTPVLLHNCVLVCKGDSRYEYLDYENKSTSVEMEEGHFLRNYFEVVGAVSLLTGLWTHFSSVAVLL